jgi:hypothetical protein
MNLLELFQLNSGVSTLEKLQFKLTKRLTLFGNFACFESFGTIRTHKAVS